ncbi:ABC-type phosphate/phosphonate transport system, periplasmic component [Roseibacterium elongatum DSM 19469]|uniref:ABC-type phosphate/phosphonate transport system, periplasmic component n=1 Tax=Roseicyclus elongatus DSM 19469 TaxID=1294273 RepID=W8RXW0_9RHOB|nr:PhnD/SsuA/transferrin family substrate-binding protein [Roseibacterium elongatum]AHM02667.1 ABC-type phosphate/phosphonate transport system, periplasmic component [Roseibacterium elongatum DSM 19469]
MIASLPMYLRPENRDAHDAWWARIRDALRVRGIDAPDALSQDAPIHATWGRADLVLGQICNLPYRSAFKDRVTLIAHADFGLPGTAPGDYHSCLIARADDPRATPQAFDGATMAINAADSHSGWGAPWMHMQVHGYAPARCVTTGAHRDSAHAVAEGRADFAAIDAVTWAMLTRWDGVTQALRVIGRTASSPGLAYITAGDVDPAPYRAALAEALNALPPAARAILGIRAITPADPARHTALPIPPAPPN